MQNETATDRSTRVYLSDVVDVDNIKQGQANIVVAPCHSGKTTAAIQKFAKLARYKERVLLLIDTTAGKDALKQNSEITSFSQQWKKDIQCLEYWGEMPCGEGIRVMTYHQLGYQLQNDPHLLDNIDVLICDEMHNLIKYRAIERSNNKNAQQSGLGELANVCDIALNEIVRLSRMESGTLVIITTATVNNVSLALHRFNAPVEYFDYTDLVSRDKTAERIPYRSIEKLLKSFPETEKAIIYCTSISQMKAYADILRERHHNVCCLWGLHNEKYPMSEGQLTVRDTLLKTRHIPDGINMLLLNAAYETSINIENEDFQTVVVHNQNPDVQVQVRGRLRHDIQKLYLYDPEHKDIAQYLPEECYDRPLFCADTKALAQKMNLKNSKGRALEWPSISKLLQSDGIVVDKVKVHDVRAYLLHKPA